MRKLATIRKIQAIKPIEGADKICAYHVDGWWIVDAIDKYKVGDLAVYLEVDSWVPTELAPFLTKGKQPREFNGVKGERLRTIKLRGTLSQGLLLNLDQVIPGTHSFGEGSDVSEYLNIQKWERAIPAQLAGLMKGSFPSFIPKTDQERVQNITKELKAAAEGNLMFEVTEKLEGSSMTVYLTEEGEFGVCSRNIDLKMDETNSFWSTALRLNIQDKMFHAGLLGYAIQGELIGPGIQNNIYNLAALQYNVFDIYDIKKGEYLLPVERRELVAKLGLMHVPVIEEYLVIDGTVDGLLAYATGNSALYPTLREGLVFKQVDGGMTFKAVSNCYLMAEKD